MHQEDAMEFSCDQESYIILSPSFFHFIPFMSCFGASHYGTWTQTLGLHLVKVRFQAPRKFLDILPKECTDLGSRLSSKEASHLYHYIFFEILVTRLTRLYDLKFQFRRGPNLLRHYCFGWWPMTNKKLRIVFEIIIAEVWVTPKMQSDHLMAADPPAPTRPIKLDPDHMTTPSNAPTRLT